MGESLETLYKKHGCFLFRILSIFFNTQKKRRDGFFYPKGTVKWLNYSRILAR